MATTGSGEEEPPYKRSKGFFSSRNAGMATTGSGEKKPPIGNYIVIGELCEGSFSVVFKATHNETHEVDMLWFLLFSGEVDNPSKTLPRALFYALVLVVLSYIFPDLTGTGAIPLDQKLWEDGYFADIGKVIGGAWLEWWIQAAAATSNMGMFLAEMSSDSFQLLGMAERGKLPEVFAKRSRYGTPLVGILFSASGVILLSWLSFQEIVAAENLLYCFGIVLEFIAFVRLRMKYPAASRPLKIPLGVLGSILMCIPPTILIGFIMAFSNLKVAAVSLVAVVIGLVLQPCLKQVEKKRWLKFSVSSHLPNLME